MKIEKSEEQKIKTKHQWYSFENLESNLKGYKPDFFPENVCRLSKWRCVFIYGILLYCNFWMGICYSLQAPFFPREAEKKGASATVYGWIIGIYSITAAISGPLATKLVVYVHTTVLCYGSVFTYGWCIILFGVLGWSPPGIVFIILSLLCRIIEAASYCIYFTSSNSLIANTFPNNKILLISLMESVFGVSMMIGPALGGPLYQLGGYFLPFAVAGVNILIGFGLCFVAIRSLDPEISTTSGSMGTLILSFSFMATLVVCGSGYFGIGFNTATLEPHVRQFHLSPSMVSIFFITYSFTYSLSSPIWGWLGDKMNCQELLLMFGIAFSIIGYLLIGPVPFMPFKETIYSVIIAQILLGIGSASEVFCAFPCLLKDAKKRGFPDDIVTYTMVLGAIFSSISIGEFIGPVLGGFLLDQVGYHSTTLYVVVIHVALGFVLVVGIIRSKLRDRTQTMKEERLHLTKSFKQISNEKTNNERKNLS